MSFMVVYLQRTASNSSNRGRQKLACSGGARVQMQRKLVEAEMVTVGGQTLRCTNGERFAVMYGALKYGESFGQSITGFWPDA